MFFDTTTALVPTTLISASLGTSATYSITSSTITQPYKMLHVVIANASHTDTVTNRAFEIELSGDGGSTWQTAIVLNPVANDGRYVSFDIKIFFADSTSQGKALVVEARADVATSGALVDASRVSTVANTAPTSAYINGIRFSFTGGNIDSGDVTLIGWN